jgi:hypothetical protein
LKKINRRGRYALTAVNGGEVQPVNRAGLKRALLGHLKDLCRLASARAKTRTRRGREVAGDPRLSARGALRQPRSLRRQRRGGRRNAGRRAPAAPADASGAANGSFGSAWPLNPFPRNGCYRRNLAVHKRSGEGPQTTLLCHSGFAPGTALHAPPVTSASGPAPAENAAKALRRSLRKS